MPARHKGVHAPPQELHARRADMHAVGTLAQASSIYTPSAQRMQRRAHSMEMAALMGESHRKDGAQQGLGVKGTQKLVRRAGHLMQPRRGF